MDKKAIIMKYLENQIRPQSASWIAKDLKGIGYKTVVTILRLARQTGEVKVVLIPHTSQIYGQIRKYAAWYIQRMCEECKDEEADHTIYYVDGYAEPMWLCNYCFGILSPHHAPSIEVASERIRKRKKEKTGEN